MFNNDFLQEWFLSNQLEGRAGTKFPFPCDTQTIIVDLIQEQDDCHVFASLQADIIKKQVELKAAIARLTAFTGTLVNSDVPMVVPIATSDPIMVMLLKENPSVFVSKKNAWIYKKRCGSNVINKK